ncbi:MAG TPA: endopeptidase La [Thermoanaerobaculia bacterium]|jgi:ATP-dependent Lon protease|nr:endopeptidase La [Thermoanaerobaculia bacterium]
MEERPDAAEPEPALPDLPEALPILVLRSAVLFPSGVIGLQVATDRSLRMVEALPTGTTLVAIFGARSGELEPAALTDFAEVGVLAEVVQVLRLGEDRQQLFLHGRERVQLEALLHTDPYFVGRVRRPAPRRLPPRLELDVLISKALDAFQALASADDRYNRETVELLRMNVEAGPDVFSDLLATYLNVPVEEKQRLVEMVNPGERLQLIFDLIEQEVARVAVDRDIQSRVKTEIEEKKREYLLREQLRIIRSTLGDDRGPEREAEQFRERIEHLPVDDESKRVLRNECSRLAVLSEQSAEYPVLHSYFETVFALPWMDRTKDSLTLQKVERTLDRNHHAVSEVKQRVLEYLAVAKLKGKLAGPILCLVGPPGTGKTSLARSIAEALGRRFIPLPLGGLNDESEIRGHRKTYVGAMPGKLIAAYQRVGSKNPLILLDEIDKIDSNYRGDPAAALLEVLDPEQNHAFLDRYLGVPFDLSETLFIATANRLDTIPSPLRDRLEVLTLAGYTEDEKLEIARRHILPEALEEHGLEAGSLQPTAAALQRIVRCYTNEAGVRDLHRRIAAICRKVARQRAAGDVPAKKRLDADDVERFLGPVLYEQEFAARSPELGLATGLAWTGAGGEILFIEAARMSGHGKVEITGHLGDVMRESVQTAYSYVRSRARDLEIPDGAFASHDVHIHFPAGAIPKDGPSAGVAVATCLASLLSGRPVRHDVAMTGELTLRGRILSVGGIKEKVLAAHRARIKTVVLPFGNKKDLTDLPEDVRTGLRIVLAKDVDDVWAEALLQSVVAPAEGTRRFVARAVEPEPAILGVEPQPADVPRRDRRTGKDRRRSDRPALQTEPRRGR